MLICKLTDVDQFTIKKSIYLKVKNIISYIFTFLKETWAENNTIWDLDHFTSTSEPFKYDVNIYSLCKW